MHDRTTSCRSQFISAPSLAPPDDLVARQARVWAQLCHICEGLAIAPAIACLLHRGWRGDRSADVPGGNPGFVAVALRAIAQSGGLPAWGGVGRAREFALVPALLACTRQLLQSHGDPVSPDPAVQHWLGRSTPRSDRLRTSLLGFLAAPALLDLPVPPFAPRPIAFPRRAPLDPLAAAALRELGWLETAFEAPILTVEGRMACAFAGQLRYPLSYLPLLDRMEALLFGDAATVLGHRPDLHEAHLDRAADIRFSSEVFDRSCASAFLEVALPLVENGSPVAVVDVGCGEATMLKALHAALGTRGLAPRDLLLVGVEANAVAAAAARATLARTGARSLVVTGDVSDPDRIAASLATQGVCLADALHINKSVIHDRGLVVRGMPADTVDDAGDDDDGVFALPDGRRVGAETAQTDLVAFFGRWRPYLGRHGMIALEPHALGVDDAVRLSGSSMTAMMEALHGFSCQYLTTAARFREAATGAGLVIARQRMIGSPLTGHDHMSCTHLIRGKEALD